MSFTYIQKQFGALIWIAIFSSSFASHASLSKLQGEGSRIQDEQTKTNDGGHQSKILANSDISKLLDDLDNQTEAIQNGKEIGDELLDDQKKKSRQDQRVGINDKNSAGRTSEELSRSNDEKVRDDSLQMVSIPEAPALIDINGIPEKTTAAESGATYLTGKPLLVLNREHNDPDMSKWFLYYPLSTESDVQMP
ncbi:uncharacterized protein [Montipora foliosa]